MLGQQKTWKEYFKAHIPTIASGVVTICTLGVAAAVYNVLAHTEDHVDDIDSTTETIQSAITHLGEHLHNIESALCVLANATITGGVESLGDSDQALLCSDINPH